MLAAKLLAGGGTATLYSDDVFAAYTRTGTGASATVTTNIDMTQGYMLWTKGRSGATDHALYHSARGVTKDFVSNTTAAETTQATGLTAVSATGHTIGALAKMNTTSATYVDWVLRNADKFYNHTTVVKSSGSNATVSFSNLTTLGMVRVKRTDSTGSWYIWHRSLTAGKLLIGETTAAEATLGHITVSGTTVTLVNGVIADGTYLVEGFAHDTGPDGLIQCGSYVAGAGDETITLGWEPQFIMECRFIGTGSGLLIQDSARGLSMTSAPMLSATTSAAESAPFDYTHPSATGYTSANGGWGSGTILYLAIRRPNKPPTTGTQVYNAIARTGTGAAATVTGVGFAPDLVHIKRRTAVDNNFFGDRLRGSVQALYSDATAAEAAFSNGVISLGMDGMSLGTGTSVNATDTIINHFFKRAPGVFDVVCWTATNSTNRRVTHSLGAVPELVLYRTRSAAGNWTWYASSLGRGKYLVGETTAAFATATNVWGTSDPTVTDFGVDETFAGLDTKTVVSYLFATLAGVSKCGSYTGNGSSQTIACGFTTGARFILIKRTDSTGDWKVIDTTRGIVAGNDPTLALNTTAAEVTGADCIDPDTSGFIVVQEATNNLNVTSATYIFLALA